MNWPGPTYTDSGGFQVMSLGVGFKKVLAMDTSGLQNGDVVAEGRAGSLEWTTTASPSTSHLDGAHTGSLRRCHAGAASSWAPTSSSPSTS